MLFTRTGLPLQSLQIHCDRLTDGSWEMLTAAYVYSERLAESAQLDLKRETVVASELFTFVDYYLTSGYTLLDIDGCDWTREELVSALTQ